MNCIVCEKSFSPKDLLTIVANPKDITKRIKPSRICEGCYEKSGIGILSVMQKFDRRGYGSVFPRPTEESDPLKDQKRDRDRLDAAMSRGSADQDVGAMRSERDRLDRVIAMRETFARPARTDRSGRPVR
jgi:hypothetical protein